MDVETESNFIRQEHRVWRIVHNFLTRNDRFPDAKDPRRAACVSAFCWNLFLSPSTVAATGGIVALLTIGLLWWQNQLLQENNSLIATSINPEQRYVISVANGLRIIRTVTERNQDTIFTYPLGVGSVLLLDLNVSCSGNSPLVIEQLDVELNFSDGERSHTVRFVTHPWDAFRQVVQPGEIVIIDARLIPAIRGDDAIHDWTREELSSGEFLISISGRDVLGAEWRLDERRLFSKHLVPSRPTVTMDSTTEDHLPQRRVEIPESAKFAVNLPEGNPNRSIGSALLSYGLKTNNNERGRVVARMSRQDR